MQNLDLDALKGKLLHRRLEGIGQQGSELVFRFEGPLGGVVEAIIRAEQHTTLNGPNVSAHCHAQLYVFDREEEN